MPTRTKKKRSPSLWKKFLPIIIVLLLFGLIPTSLILQKQNISVTQVTPQSGPLCREGDYSCIAHACKQGNFSCAFCAAPWVKPLVKNNSVKDPWFGKDQWDGKSITCN